ncbi:MAG: EamA family transporter [Spirosomataceae bacterium]
MVHFILAVVFTVSLYLMMCAFPKYHVNTLHAVVFNYYTCVAMGLLLIPNANAYFNRDWTTNATILTLALGIMFVIVFVLIGQTTTKVGVTVASLAGNMSLVIPVLFGLFIFKNNNKDFTFLNYLGLVMALVALALSTIKKEKGGEDAPKVGWVLFLPVLLFLGSGTNNTLINYVSATFYQSNESALFTAIACTGAILAGTLFLVFRIIATKETITWRSVLGGLLLGIPNFSSFYFLLKALQDFGNSAAFVFPIYNILSMLASSLMAWILFRETLQPLNKLGLALAILAIYLISYQEILGI